jgi:hypothetical protein
MCVFASLGGSFQGLIFHQSEINRVDRKIAGNAAKMADSAIFAKLTFR